MMDKSYKILVTGATGYIGAHVVKALSERGHVVTGTDCDDKQNDISKYAEFIYWDIDFNDVNVVLEERSYDKIIHLAARTKVPNSVANPLKYYTTNVLGTSHVTSIPCDHFIYCSTGSAFDPVANPYAGSKYAGELITKQFYPNNHSIVRFYNVSGNDGMLKYDDDVSHLIRKAARVANSILHNSLDCNAILNCKIAESEVMNVYGTDYDTRDGTCIRNYTHITDIVNGIINIVEAEPTNKIECLGSPDGTSVKEVIDTMNRVSGVELNQKVMPRREGDVAISVVPEDSPFFTQTKTLDDMCIDALEVEK